MLFRLHTVRRKLTVLVASTLGVVLVVIVVLSWLLHRQLMDEVDNRVDEAKSGFQSELDDDLTDQSLSLKVMATDDAVVTALVNDDAKSARAVAQVFADVYPELDFIIADRDGRVLTELGVTAPPERIDSISELNGVAKGADFNGIIEHGCEKPGSGAPPAIVMAKASRAKGRSWCVSPSTRPTSTTHGRSSASSSRCSSRRPGGSSSPRIASPRR